MSTTLFEVSLAVLAIVLIMLIVLDLCGVLTLSSPGFIYPLIVLLPIVVALLLFEGLNVALGISSIAGGGGADTAGEVVPGLIVDLSASIVLTVFVLYAFVKSNIIPLFRRKGVQPAPDHALRASRRLAHYGLVASLIYQMPLFIAFLIYCGWLLQGTVQNGFVDGFLDGILGTILTAFLLQFIPVLGVLIQGSTIYLYLVLCIGCFATWVWALNAAIRAVRAVGESRTELVVCAVGTCIPVVDTVALIVICRILARKSKTI